MAWDTLTIEGRRRFYKGAAWRALREWKLRQSPLCEPCAAQGLTVPAEHIDHRVPLARGGAPLDLENCTAMCIPCHSRKTRAEMLGLDRAPILGCCIHGNPLDPDDPWNKSGGCPKCKPSAA